MISHDYGMQDAHEDFLFLENIKVILSREKVIGLVGFVQSFFVCFERFLVHL